MKNTPIIIALDQPKLSEVLRCTEQLDPKLCRLKIGKSLFTRYGADLVKTLQKQGFEIFLDLKFHDIPHQVSLAVEAVIDLGVWMLTLHALGGLKMLEAAQNRIEAQKSSLKLVAVTILTSIDNAQYSDLGFAKTLSEEVLNLATLAKKSGISGVVASAQEAGMIRQVINKPFILVTPGIRWEQAPTLEDDQSRILTPEEALKNGVDYLVIGRPITQADSPYKALEQLFQLIPHTFLTF